MTLHPEVKKGFQFREDDDDSDAQPLRNYSWSKLLAKVFKIDVTTCDACGGPMKKISAITDPIQPTFRTRNVLNFAANIR